VTDRRRLVGAGNRPSLAVDRLLALTDRAVEAGVDVIQLRERDLQGGALTTLAAQMVARAARSLTRIVVNDRLDVALAAGAHGVHLRADSVPPRAARAIAPPGFLIGRSVHSADEARRVEDHVDYMIAGTVWATPSKPTASTLLGVDGLAAIVAATRVPVLGIGGVTIDRMPELSRSGAAGCAAIGLFAGAAPARADGAAGPGGSLVDLVRRLRERSRVGMS
jgi:thiamine-phosphate pyrophosphorylase